MLAQALKFVIGNKWLFGVFAVALVLAYFIGRDHGGDAVRAVYAADAQKADRIEEQSEGEAAQERESDTTEIETAREARDDAIENAGGTGRPSAAAIALNCERLRRAGTDVSQLPACAGRAGGAETRSRP